MKKSFAERCVPYLFIAGTFLMLIVFMYFSVGLAFYTSLTDKMPGRETHFIGLENYKALLSDDMFRMSFRNQAVLSLFAVFNSVFFPLLAALMCITSGIRSSPASSRRCLSSRCWCRASL